MAGLPERDGDLVYNSAVVVTPAGYLGVYRKIHLFYQEKVYFAPGNLGFQVFDVPSRDGAMYRLGVMPRTRRNVWTRAEWLMLQRRAISPTLGWPPESCTSSHARATI